MKFDKRKIAQLAAGSNESIDGFPGLRIAVTKTKRTWFYRYRVDKALKQVKLGEWPAMDYAAAISAWKTARTARENGIDAAAEKKAKRQPAKAEVSAPVVYSVRKLCTDYLGKLERTRTPLSLAAVTAMFRRSIEPIANREPHTITRAEANDLIEGLADRPAIAAKLKANLGAAWENAINSGRLPDTTPNHWRAVFRGHGALRSTGHVRGGEKTTERRVLDDAEVASIFAWLPNTTDLLSDVLTLALFTGARSGEIVQIEGKEVRREGDGVLWLTMKKSKTKNRNRPSATDLRVPLIGRAAAIVERLKLARGEGYLFPSVRRAGHIAQNSVGEELAKRMKYHARRINDGLTVSGWALHDCRRTARTMLAKLGCPHEIGEAILSHVLAGVAGAYNRHSYDEERVQWLTALSDKWESLAAGSVGADR
ncbi:tyrosine-type recombinase/integrase [Caballeronia sordidicola]|uniref:tyrosine-type recombinase/integrase n=1 Tax=Caballeronia sordidicola TaxID=196367 RepID=UPI0004D03140|nr:integrase family protein [Caballeronia sordidicola]